MKYLSFLTLFTLALNSCAVADKNYHSLAASAESNASNDTIVGMWHRKWSDGMGLNHVVSLLVNQDGTGVESFYAKGWAVGTADMVSNFTWSQQSDGTWKMQLPKQNMVWTCRYSQGKLLRSTDDYSPGLGPLGRVSNVFERVNP